MTPPVQLREEAEVGPVVLGQQAAGAVDDLFEAPGAVGAFAGGCGASRPRADLAREIPAGVDGAVAKVADEGFFFAVAEPGDGQDGAGVGGDDGAEVAMQGEPKRSVVLGLDFLDGHGGRRACSRFA